MKTKKIPRSVKLWFFSIGIFMGILFGGLAILMLMAFGQFWVSCFAWIAMSVGAYAVWSTISWLKRKTLREYGLTERET